MKVLLIDPPHRLFPGLRMWTPSFGLLHLGCLSGERRNRGSDHRCHRSPESLEGSCLLYFVIEGRCDWNHLLCHLPFARGDSDHWSLPKTFTEIHHRGGRKPLHPDGRTYPERDERILITSSWVKERVPFATSSEPLKRVEGRRCEGHCLC